MQRITMVFFVALSLIRLQSPAVTASQVVTVTVRNPIDIPWPSETVVFGYVTLPLKYVSGSRLRIQLSRAVQDKDAVGNIMEITGGKDAVATGVAPEKAEGTLGIVEAEIYKITQN